MDKRVLYKMTQSQTMIMIKDVPDGTEISIDNWCVFSETDDDNDKETTIMTLKSGDDVYATQSSTFMNSIYTIDEIMEDEEYSIIKISGQTKAGLPFVNCELA